MSRHSKLLVLASIVLVLAACGRGAAPVAADTPTPPAGSGTAPPKEEHVDLGQMKIDSGASVSLPADFPADIPLPPDAKLTDAISMGKIYIVSFTLPTDPGATFATLLPLYQAQGWNNYSRVGGQPIMSTDGYEKDGRKLVYTVVADGAGSKVSLRQYPKAE
jgi:hypothetical protein